MTWFQHSGACGHWFQAPFLLLAKAGELMVPQGAAER
jgi:hypothetical protein